METAYVFLALLILLMYSLTIWHSSQEGFENEHSITFEDPEQIFDDVYASIYNDLWNSRELLKYEEVSIHEIALAEKPTKTIKVLDMCCGTSPHACYFTQLGIDFVGVDISEAMLARARQDCPSAKFQKGDITQVHLFPQKSLSTILLLGFSVYSFQNPKILFDNAYQWLQPEGFLVLHLVDPDKFDPLHDLASPFASFSLQKYSLDRQTDSTIFFDQFKYVGSLKKKPNEDEAVYQETLTYYDPTLNNGIKYRENKHRWSMPSKERMIDIVKTSGFKHVETQDLLRVSKEYQYLVYFTK